MARIQGFKLRIIDAVERQQIAIPMSEVMGANGALSFYSQIRDRGYFDVDFRGSELVLVAGNFVGQIPLTSDLAINVKPKFPISNLARIVGLANQPIRCLDFFRRTYVLEDAASDSLLEAIARSLAASLIELENEGLYRAYEPRTERLAGVRGRLDASSYVSAILPRGISSKVDCTYFVLATDTVLNRLIKRAIFKLGDDLGAQGCSDKSLLMRLSHFSDYFESVALDHSPYLVDTARQYLLHHKIPELRSYYLNILDVCFVVLGGKGVHLIEQMGTDSMHSFIVNMEDAFEQYIRHVLQEARRLKSNKIPVLNGNSEGLSKLFVDNAKYSAKPDLVIGEVGATIALGDVKYKTKLAEADRYQLIAHSLAYGVKRAFIVTPSNDGFPSGPSYVGKVGADSGIEIHQYCLNLQSADMAAEERAFQSWVEQLVLGGIGIPAS